MSYIKYLTQHLEYFNFLNEDTMNETDLNEANIFAEDNNVLIYDDKKLITIVKESSSNKLIGALWTSWNVNEEFSFETIVDVKYGNMGIGSKLVDEAIEEYNFESKKYKNPKMRMQVISQIMEKMLLKRNFKIESVAPGRKIMIRK
jgi:predicted unusual protein kinase regulating ubiquinone biosynthesis (AarF/ABC1/UbiB family)